MTNKWNLRDEIIEARTTLLESADGHYWEDADLSKRAGDYQQQIDITEHMIAADEASHGDDNLTVTEAEADALHYALMVVDIWDTDPRDPAQADADQMDAEVSATHEDARM